MYEVIQMITSGQDSSRENMRQFVSDVMVLQGSRALLHCIDQGSSGRFHLREGFIPVRGRSFLMTVVQR